MKTPFPAQGLAEFDSGRLAHDVRDGKMASTRSLPDATTKSRFQVSPLAGPVLDLDSWS
jgi:hypothetical protein